MDVPKTWARGWDGIDPGRTCHFLPPDGNAKIETCLNAGRDEADVRDYLHVYFESFSYCQALDVRLAEAAAGQLSPEAALKATAIDFEEITIRLGRDQQRRAYRASLGF